MFNTRKVSDFSFESGAYWWVWFINYVAASDIFPGSFYRISSSSQLVA